MGNNIMRFFGIFAILLAIIFLALAGAAFFYTKSFDKTEYLLTIAKGDSASSVATKLKNDGIIYTRTGFLILAKITRLNKKIKPGSFHLRNPVSAWDIVKSISQPPQKITITLVEGWKYERIKKLLDNNPKIRHSTSAWTEQELLNFLAKSENYLSVEGLLLPGTFYFYEGVEDKEVYQLAYQLSQQELKKQWDNRAEGLPYKSPYELLIMASIIEKETAHPEDRALVAAVFVNRLKLGMRLQTDPTVIYGMGTSYQGNIRKEDLYRDTPYNTYTRNGLPPTPIAMPSPASLHAAAHPAKEDYLYFVSKHDKTGRSYFSWSLPEHNAAVRKYLLRK